MAGGTVGQGGSYATEDKLLCLRVADNNRVIVAARRRCISRIHSEEEPDDLNIKRIGMPGQERDGAKSESEYLQHDLAAIARRIWNERHCESNAQRRLENHCALGHRPMAVF
jgi:hypothetical protein